MSGQRMLHPEQSLSKKVTALTDFEYRVFEQVKLSSDDFGVMPYTATVLRADNLKLRATKESVVFAALKQLVLTGLLLVFEHQDEAYVCAPVWQKWQQIRFPRKTTRPKPPAEILAQCNDETRDLFRKYPGGRTKGDGQTPDNIPTSDGHVPRHDVHLTRSDGGEVHANANANASANANARESTRGVGSVPLIVSPLQFEKANKSWAFHGSRLKVPHVLHRECRDALGGMNPDLALQAWYLVLNAEADASGEPILDVFKWLRPKFVVWGMGHADADAKAKFLREVSGGR